MAQAAANTRSEGGRPSVAPAPIEAPAPRRDPSDVPQTSVARRHRAPDECTVQFRRWTPHGITAYQVNQFAGFKYSEAMKLIATGAAVLIEGPTRTSTPSVMK